MKSSTEIIKLADDLKYLKDEFEVENKLWSAAPDGYVTLEGIIKYCKDNDYLLEHIIKVARQVNDMK